MKIKTNIVIWITSASIAVACTRNGMDSQQDGPSDRSAAPARVKSAPTATEDSLNLNHDNRNVDSAFVLSASEGGMMEVHLGRLAQNQSSSTEIQSFGKSMIIDHGKANQELQALAEQLHINLPQKLSDKNQKKLDSLSQMKGSKFDLAFAKAMIADHKEAIALFNTESSAGRHKALVSWADAKIPTLEHHLLMAETMHSTLDKTPGKE